MDFDTSATHIGLGDDARHDDARQATLSRDAAAALLRLCAPSAGEERAYTSVQMLAVPNGSSLYVKAQVYG